MLHEVAPGLWVVERPQRFAGAELGARMTVIQLADSGLFVHSPVALDSELSRELTNLGEVRCVIAPNRMHHLHAHEYAGAFRGTKTFGSPASVKKRHDLHFDGVLGDTAAPEWAGQLEQRFFAPVLAETVFFSPATRTLVCCRSGREHSARSGRDRPPFAAARRRLSAVGNAARDRDSASARLCACRARGVRRNSAMGFRPRNHGARRYCGARRTRSAASRLVFRITVPMARIARTRGGEIRLASFY
jgi:Domain of unknown function (DUF4336)